MMVRVEDTDVLRRAPPGLTPSEAGEQIMANQLEDDLKTTFHWSSAQAERFMVPEAASCPGFHNIKIRFDNFRYWRDNNLDPHRTLRSDVTKYAHDKDQYINTVTKFITKTISHTFTGAAVLREISACKPRTVTISPFHPLVDDPDDATTTPDDPDRATWIGRAQPDDDPEIVKIMGTGSNSAIHFTPGRPEVVGPASKPDEVLLHELVHASRQMRGVRFKGSVNKDFDNEEEFIAIVIDNIYLSEKGQTDLRANHNGHKRLPTGFRDHFLDNWQHLDQPPRWLIEAFRNRQLLLYHDLAKIPKWKAKWNPVRQWEQMRAKELS